MGKASSFHPEMVVKKLSTPVGKGFMERSQMIIRPNNQPNSTSKGTAAKFNHNEVRLLDRLRVL